VGVGNVWMLGKVMRKKLGNIVYCISIVIVANCSCIK